MRRRFKFLKPAIAFSTVVLFLYLGFQGRQQARLQAGLEDIAPLRDQLQQALENERGGSASGGLTNASQLPPDGRARMLAGALRTGIGQFETDYRPDHLPGPEDLEIRLCRAVLANAEQRFSDALAALTETDESGKASSSDEAQTGRLIRVLQARGDAFFGLGRWRESLERYQRILILKPNRLATIERVADCSYSLEKVDEAVALYESLAKSHNNRGHVLLVRGKSDGAAGHYRKAVAIQTRLVEREGKKNLSAELAADLTNLGGALFLQQKLEEAAGCYEKAIAIQARLIEQEGRKEFADRLAANHHDLGNVYFVRGNPEAAGDHYKKAIEIETRLIEGNKDLARDLAMSYDHLADALLGQPQLDIVIGHYQKAITIQTVLAGQEGDAESSHDLAMSYNNRGAVRRAQGKLGEALGDFEKAINVLTPLIARQDGNEPPQVRNLRDGNAGPRVKLDIAVAYSERDVNVLTRTRLAGLKARNEWLLALAISHKNRGYAGMAQGKGDAAIADLKKAVELYGGLVEREGQRDLTAQYAATLNSLAWIHATNPDDALRDGGKAREYALKACELSDWKAVASIATLAAASAEAGQFSEAVRWQERAIELAPAESKAGLHSRLEVYRSRKPLRAPLPKAE